MTFAPLPQHWIQVAFRRAPGRSHAGHRRSRAGSHPGDHGAMAAMVQCLYMYMI